MATFITGTELRPAADGKPALAIYWVGSEQEPGQYGICFPGEGFGIARQSCVESLMLGDDMLDSAIDQIARSAKRDHG